VLIVTAIPTMPYWASNGHIRWAIELSCLSAIAQMWNLLDGYAGLVSFGQQAFIGVGGYVLFVVANEIGFNPFWSVSLSAIAAAVVSFFGQYGAAYLVVLGLLTLIMALFSPGGIWSLVSRLVNWSWFPVTRMVVDKSQGVGED
jgi:ABC-type branched-subunit amino acid transport system permease subunit